MQDMAHLPRLILNKPQKGGKKKSRVATFLYLFQEGKSSEIKSTSQD